MKNKSRLKNKINSRLNQHIRRKFADTEEIEVQWNEERLRLTKLLRKINEDEFFVVARTDEKIIAESTFRDIEAARARFKEVSQVVSSIRLNILGRHETNAKKFIKKKMLTKEAGETFDASRFKDAKNLSFFFMVGHLIETGFKMPDFEIRGRSTTQDKTTKNIYSIGNRLFTEYGDIVLSNPTDDNYIDCRERLVELMDSVSLDDPMKYASNTISTYFHYTLKTALIGAKFAGNLKVYEAEIRSMMDEIWVYTKNNEYSQASEKGHLRKSMSHKPLNIDKLESFLIAVSNKDFALLNYFILALSTALRPTEMQRINERGIEEFCIDGKFLDYKSGHLVTKTGGKIDSETLVNPQLSIISRVIIKHYPLASNTVVKESFKKRPGAASSIRRGPFKDIYERRFRITCGYMLGMCTKAIDPNVAAHVHTIKDRMGHISINQAITTYAKDLIDQEKVAENYFGLKSLNVDGTNVSHGFPLWDSWLLRLWLKRLKTVIGETAFKEAKSRVVEEYEQYRLSMGSSVENMDDDDL